MFKKQTKKEQENGWKATNRENQKKRKADAKLLVRAYYRGIITHHELMKKGEEIGAIMEICDRLREIEKPVDGSKVKP